MTPLMTFNRTTTQNGVQLLVLWITLALCSVSTLLFAQKVDRTNPPKLGPAPSLQLPPIQHLTLSNGLGVVLLEKHNLPLCQVELTVRAG